MTKTTKLPFIRLWIDDFTITTKHKSTFDIGAYVNLVVAAWRAGGSLPDDDKLLARIVGAYSGRSQSRWQQAKPRIMALWTLKNGRWTCPWIADEWEYATTKKSSMNNGLPSPAPRGKAAPAPEPTPTPQLTPDKPSPFQPEEHLSWEQVKQQRRAEVLKSFIGEGPHGCYMEKETEEEYQQDKEYYEKRYGQPFRARLEGEEWVEEK
jgi:uncharacterized protein YdaU (DUF1376 family)